MGSARTASEIVYDRSLQLGSFADGLDALLFRQSHDLLDDAPPRSAGGNRSVGKLDHLVTSVDVAVEHVDLGLVNSPYMDVLHSSPLPSPASSSQLVAKDLPL